jgi:hypothetical protein
MERRASPDLMIAVLKRRTDAVQKSGEARLSFN